MTFFKEIWEDALRISKTLFKIMIPMLLVIKVVEELGGIELLADLLTPLMQTLGLPGEMALVWASTLLINIYAGLMVLVYLNIDLTVAQASVLGTLMLLSHGLPIEATIARSAGVSLRATLLIRIGGGALLAWMLHQLYQWGGLLQQQAIILWAPEQQADTGYLGWALTQLESLAMIFVVILILLTGLRILKILGIERLLALILSPFLLLLGISREATNLTIIGATLGLSFGGGLLINEARLGHIKARDIFMAMMLLNILHSLIEDTLLILLIGADFNSIFWGRILFSFIVISLLGITVRMLSEQFCLRHFYRDVRSG